MSYALDELRRLAASPDYITVDPHSLPALPALHCGDHVLRRQAAYRISAEERYADA